MVIFMKHSISFNTIFGTRTCGIRNHYYEMYIAITLITIFRNDNIAGLFHEHECGTGIYPTSVYDTPTIMITLTKILKHCF